MQACDTQIDLSSPTARGQPVSQQQGLDIHPDDLWASRLISS